MLGCLMGFDILQDLRVNFDPLVKKKKKRTVLSLSDYNSFFIYEVLLFILFL